MAFDAHTPNFSFSLVATAPSPATSGTSLVVTAGGGALFPAAPFNATVWPVGVQPLASNAEIVRVTAISTDTLTIVRAQEGSSARTIIVGDQIAATITAKTFTDIEGADALKVVIANNLSDLASIATARTNLLIFEKSAFVAGSNYTTSSSTAASITGLSIAVAANKTYRIEASLWVGCNNTGGIVFGLSGPAGSAVVSGVVTGSATSSLTINSNRLTAMGTQIAAAAAIQRVNSSTGMATIIGFITIAGTAGNITIQCASGVDTQTSTIYIGSGFSLTEVQ